MMWILKNKLPLNIMNLRHKVINHKNSTMDTIARELTPMFHHPEKKLQAKQPNKKILSYRDILPGCVSIILNRFFFQY